MKKTLHLFCLAVLVPAFSFAQWLSQASAVMVEERVTEHVEEHHAPSRMVKKNKLSAKFFELPGLSVNTEPQSKSEGVLKGYDANGNLFFTVPYRNQKVDGTWQSQYPDGKPRDMGMFLKSIPHGEWKGYYANGNPKFIRSYNANKWYAVRGEIKRRHPKLNHYPITQVALQRPDQFTHVISAGYSFGTLPAEAAAYQPPFTECFHHGLYMNYYENGQVKDSGYYKDGLRDGIWQEYYTNGQVKSSGFYINGQKHSGWANYSETGQLLSLKEYRNGQLLHEKHYQQSGTAAR